MALNNNRGPLTLTRRQFGATAAAAATIGVVAGCDNGSGAADGTLTFQTWANPVEEAAFQAAIDEYIEQNPDVTVNLDVTPFPQHYQSLDTRLAAGEGPDLVRIQYQQMGHYSQEGAVVDLSEYLPEDYQSEYLPSFWQAISYEGAPHGVPIDTGTFGIFYNVALFDSLGISVPDAMEDAWTWEELESVSQTLIDSGEVDHALAMAWQPAPNAYRWLTFLYQAGGRLLGEDLTSAGVGSQAAIDAVAYTQSWFDEGIVPPDTSIKSGTEVQTLFATGAIAMMMNGDFQMSFLQENMDDEEWDVTYLVQGAESHNVLGGNGVGVTADCQQPELAADFLRFLNNRENQRARVVDSSLLPTRADLSELSAEELGYEFRPELKQLFIDQLPHVTEVVVNETTAPDFGTINVALGDELEAAFREGQTPEDTVARLENRINDTFA